MTRATSSPRRVSPSHVRLDAAAYDRARARGVRYSVRIPMKAAGGYQVRAAVQDDRSARVGTSAQFIEVPNVGPGRVALSGVIMTDAGDAGSPMATTFAPGTVVEYTCTIYDGRKDRAVGLSTTATVLLDGKPVYTSPPAPIAGAATNTPAVSPGPVPRPAEPGPQSAARRLHAGRQRRARGVRAQGAATGGDAVGRLRGAVTERRVSATSGGHGPSRRRGGTRTAGRAGRSGPRSSRSCRRGASRAATSSGSRR